MDEDTQMWERVQLKIENKVLKEALLKLYGYIEFTDMMTGYWGCPICNRVSEDIATIEHTDTCAVGVAKELEKEQL